MKKKILFVSEALWIGGIETALVNLLNRMDYEKYDVTCLVVRGSLEVAHRITPKCRLLVADRDKTYTFYRPYRHSRLYHLTEESETPSRLHRAMMWAVPAIKWAENRLYIRYIRDCMSGERFDTCVIYSDRTAEAAVRSINADKYLLFYHNARMEKAYHDEIGYRKSRKIIAVSESKTRELKAFRPRYAEKCMTVHNLVDAADVKEKSRQLPATVFPKDAFNLVTCGRLVHQKAIDWAIRTMALLVQRGFRDLQWWVVGGGPEEEKLKKQIREAGLADRFHLLGMQSNPYPYIANADLYVQPSRWENYSVVILEAMVLCRPILATAAAAQEQITSRENGLLCGEDPESLAAGIEYLYLHRAEMEKYRQALEENGPEKQNEEIMDSLYRLFDGE